MRSTTEALKSRCKVMVLLWNKTYENLLDEIEHLKAKIENKDTEIATIESGCKKQLKEKDALIERLMNRCCELEKNNPN